MSQLRAIFEQILTDHLRGLQAACRAPAPVEAEEEEFVACDSCGAPSTHDVYDSGDPSVGYGSAWVPMCDDCDIRGGR
jgi:hypothetical protein